LKPWKDFSKTKLVFSFAEKYLWKKRLFFCFVFFGRAKKMKKDIVKDLN